MDGDVISGGGGEAGGGGGASSSPYGVLNLQGSMQVHRHQHHHNALNQQQQQGSPMVHPQMHDVFPLTMGNLHECQHRSISVVGERGKSSTSDEDDPEGRAEGGRGKKGSPWQRMKWTDTMVRVLITIVSYMGEDAISECNNSSSVRRKFTMLQKKGKWKSVSKVMAERDFYVSPQQCEDKFNDLNKRYKRLTDILGRGTSCQVVENPALLDVMDHVSVKGKETVRKILNSKHLFYEEMCSYHNGNRLHLPPDPALQRSVQLALTSRDDDEIQDTRSHLHDGIGEEDVDAETDDHGDDDADENQPIHGDNGIIFGVPESFPLRVTQGRGHEDVSFGNPFSIKDSEKRSYLHPQNIPVNMNQVFSDGSKAAWLQKQWMMSRSLQLEEQKLEIQAQMLELEKHTLKWQRYSRKKDRELDKLRMENEWMKLENERMALDLRHKELELTKTE